MSLRHLLALVKELPLKKQLELVRLLELERQTPEGGFSGLAEDLKMNRNRQTLFAAAFVQASLLLLKRNFMKNEGISRLSNVA